MAIQPIRTAPAPFELVATPGDSPSSPPALPVIRFRLRHLFWAVTALSLLLAGLAATAPGPMPLLLLIAVLIITAHVSATAIGNRLRRHANETRAWDTQHSLTARVAADGAEHRCDLRTANLPPVSPWHERGGTSLGWLPKLVMMGAIVAGFGGAALFLSGSIGRNASPAGIAVGAISLAVLGAWLTFLAGSFYAIFRHGLREAMAQQCRDESRSSLRR
jgi:hypothetical protein